MKRRTILVAAAAVVLSACTSEGGGGDSEPTDTPSTGQTNTSPTSTASPLWENATPHPFTKGRTYTNRVDLADIDRDGDVDILFADGGNYEYPGKAVRSRIFLNDGSAGFTDVSQQVLGNSTGIARVIKARDFNGDGNVDIIVGNTFETQSRLYLGRGDLRFDDVTATNLPQVKASIGDLEVGDVDADGDLDLVLADWSPGNPLFSRGSPPMLWLNDGEGRFTDVSRSAMPPNPIKFSWELELVDVDNDWDLDLAVSCKVCTTSVLYQNDGRGRFRVVKGAIPASTNNYEFEPMDVDGDGDEDLVTSNDSADVDLGEHIFVNDGTGRFSDETEDRWPGQAPYGYDDSNVAFLDVDSDGDADFLIGSLDGPDRVLLNDGAGHFSVNEEIREGAPPTPGTTWLAVADLNGDNKLDLVEAQGEVAWPDFVYMGLGVASDAAPPVVSGGVDIQGSIHARIDDRKSPSMASDWREVVVQGRGERNRMEWYGEYLWRTRTLAPGTYRVCATDAAGNQACSEQITVG
jgi:FG-GAP-like repeat